MGVGIHSSTGYCRGVSCTHLAQMLPDRHAWFDFRPFNCRTSVCRWQAWPWTRQSAGMHEVQDLLNISREGVA
jgi:hypothetical protein